MPTVSIIIPAYNASLYLRECVDSVINQGFKDWELILVDDGSTDETVNICREYASSASNISYHSQSNQGVSVARNKGLEMANGEFVMFIDADDFLPPDSLEIFYKAYLANKNADIIRGEYDAVDQYGKRLFTSNKKVFNKRRLYCEKDINKFIFKYIKSEYFLWLMWIRRNTIDNIRFTKGHIYMEDAEFLFSVFPKVHKSVYIPMVIYNYRKHIAAASSSFNGSKLRDIISLITQLTTQDNIITTLTKDTINYAVNNCWQMVFDYLSTVDNNAKYKVIENYNLRNKVNRCLSEGFSSSDMKDFINLEIDSFIMNFNRRQKAKKKLNNLIGIVSYLKSRF